MSIRNKILLSFSGVTITMMAAALFFIYTLFSQYREAEFQQRQKVKIETTLKFLTEIKDIDQELIEAMDRITIHDIYDEKLLIFDKNKSLVYSSIDDMPIAFSNELLSKLSDKTPWLERKDGLYDVVAVYLKHEQKAYYGISKALDVSGYLKLQYLRYTLIITLGAISLAVILVAFYLSKKITYSIVDVARQINEFDFNVRGGPQITTGATDEVSILVQRFNELMKRMNAAFAFQKHAVHHISHELKTPIAVLVSNFERMEKETDQKKLHRLIEVQKRKYQKPEQDH
jgi:signal transduction histidine kinase